MRLWALVAIVLLCACGSTSSVSSGSPSPSASPSPSPSPSPVATLPCQMHAEVGVDQGGYRSLLGTITLPAGTITVDPNHHIIGSSAPNGVIWATDTSPQLYGNGGAAYSTQLGGWLPVPPELVAPDGLHYAYLHPDGTIRLGNSTGQEGIIPNPQKLTPLAFTTSGVVLTGSDIASNGLWMLDTTTHAITPITPAAGNDDWREVVNGVAWGVDSPGVLGYPAPTKLLTVSVQPAGSASVAYTAPAGDSIALIAVDRQGGVLVDLKGSAAGLVYIAAGGGVSPATAATGVALAQIGPRHHADAHGIWFLGLTGIFLFTQSTGLQSLGPGLQKDVVPGSDCV